MARNAKFQPMYPLLEGVPVSWQIQVLVGTGISAQQGMISISEIKRNHMGQGRGGDEAKVTFSFFKNAVTIAEV